MWTTASNARSSRTSANPTVAVCLTGRPYKKDKKFQILFPLGDNSAAWQKFCHEELEVPISRCQTHATAVAANNCSHRTHFENMVRYKEFYKFVCCIMQCSSFGSGEWLQEMLVQFLLHVGETHAANWFEEWWCEPVNGQ